MDWQGGIILTIRVNPEDNNYTDLWKQDNPDQIPRMIEIFGYNGIHRAREFCRIHYPLVTPEETKSTRCLND